ncbi:erythroblast NAD(P)(+)--arginine ADP-ribosyltransferase-like isoform 1-T2 [Fundulus diaphanus]
MKTKMLFFGSLCLFLCCMLQEIIGTSNGPDNQSFPLDMAENSVDDRYSTCAARMEEKVKDTYFKKETKEGPFKKAWDKAKSCANKQKQPGDEDLTKDHIQAICVYTAGGPVDLYKKFNEAVRTRKNDYKSSFPFHSLHFWLTRAIQILNKNKCETTFRRTKAKFTGKVNQEMRFGTFTSTSRLSDKTQFGRTTCFKVETCHGAYLKNYPTLGDREQEVLIPPYEKFKIISTDKPNGLKDCDTVYVLKSSGVRSDLDCKIAKKTFL